MNHGGIVMSKPIESTPILYGKDAVDFLNGLCKPLTEKQKKIIKRRQNHQIVYW